MKIEFDTDNITFNDLQNLFTMLGSIMVRRNSEEYFYILKKMFEIEVNKNVDIEKLMTGCSGNKKK